jgi:preprotein translocase subunit SecG
MLLVFVIVIIAAALILGLIVLIQNPKGGGLSGTFGGFSNQLMGVKQTTDVLEKGTWVLAITLAFLCVISPAFTHVPSQYDKDLNTNLSAPVIPNSNSGNTAPLTK